MSAQRLLLVHAHPDDESIVTGATIAHYAARGVQVTVVTCTLGEQGEILVPELAQLDATRGDQLGGYRMGELATAMAALGVTDHRYLGGAGRFRDSGMQDTAANEHPRAFWQASRDEAVFSTAVEALAQIICDVRPQVVVTYDDEGGYGHPDHVMAHRVTHAAVDAAALVPSVDGDRPWTVAKLYWIASPHSSLERDFAVVSERADHSFIAVPADESGFGVDDALVTAVVDAGPAVAAKTAALAAHRTQVIVDGQLFALSNMAGRVIDGQEHFRLVRGEPGGPLDAPGRETDLFGGVDEDSETDVDAAVSAGPAAVAAGP